MNGIEQLVRRILATAAVLALLTAGCAGFYAGPAFALSVLAGAALAGGSFFLMQRDVGSLLDHVAENAGSGGSHGGLLKAGFWLRAVGRVAVLVLLLAVLVVKAAIHPVGLVLGLTTIPAGVVFAGLAGTRERMRRIPD